MKKIITSTLVGLLLSSAAYAQKLVMDSTNLYQTHTRALSMGNAFTAVVPNGETAMNYNIAGLAQTREDSWVLDILLGGQLALNAELAEDLQNNNNSSVEKSREFVDKYKDDANVVNGQGWYHVSSQFGLESLPLVQRIGIGYQRYFSAFAVLQLPESGDKPIDITDSEQAVEQVSELLENKYDKKLTSEEKKKLKERIDELKDDPKADQAKADLRQAQDDFNTVLGRAVDFRYALFDIQGVGGAVSILDDKLKLGLQMRYYNLVSARHLEDYSLMNALSEDDQDLDKIATEQKGQGVGYEIGALYRGGESFIYQVGTAYQNIGGVKIQDVEIPASLNVGGSLQWNWFLGSFTGSFEVKDLLAEGAYEQDGVNDKRSWGQRSHVGVQAALIPIPNPDEYLLYASVGLNQLQPTYGVQVSLPWHILRLGYTKYGADIGNASEKKTYENDQVFVSLGLSI